MLPAAPQTFTVMVDGHTEDNHGIFEAFFPNELTVHPGDTIEFVLADSGEPHTVTLGTKADDAVKLAEELKPGADPISVLRRAGLTWLFPGWPADVANPCVVEEGRQRCSSDPAGVFTGTETFYGSGALLPERPFVLTLADDIAPGSYGFICLAHGAHMSGAFTVVDHDTAIESPDQVARRGREELAATAGELEVVIEEASAAAAEDEVIIGGPRDAELPHAHGGVFVPGEVTVATGEQMRWRVNAPHTISFNWPEDAVGAAIVDGRGRIRENRKMHDPAPPAARGGGEWDGTGFFSSGMILPPGVYSLSFTNPGTYRFRCLMHNDMEGVVKVVAP